MLTRLLFLFLSFSLIYCLFFHFIILFSSSRYNCPPLFCFLSSLCFLHFLSFLLSPFLSYQTQIKCNMLYETRHCRTGALVFQASVSAWSTFRLWYVSVTTSRPSGRWLRASPSADLGSGRSRSHPLPRCCWRTSTGGGPTSSSPGSFWTVP